jgi:hypothetical protein
MVGVGYFPGYFLKPRYIHLVLLRLIIEPSSRYTKRAALHLEAGPIPFEADCMQF